MRPFSAFRQIKLFIPGCVQGVIIYLVCRCMCMCVCVTFAVFTDCDSCTRPISANSGSMEAGEHGLTRGVRFVAVCLEVVAVAGLMWVSWCVFGGAGFFCFFQVTTISNSYTQTAVSVYLAKGFRQPANLPTENSRPPFPTRCTV